MKVEPAEFLVKSGVVSSLDSFFQKVIYELTKNILLIE